MSIAIYAVIKPSRTLRLLVRGMCLATLGVAAVIGFGWVGELDPAPRAVIGVCCAFIAFSVFYQRPGSASEFHIHISGTGRIRLAEFKTTGSGTMTRNLPLAKMEGEARLMPATTIWPWLLLLRLQRDDRTVVTVPILPDCVPEDTFRTLSVSCRWLATQGRSMKY